MRCILLAVLGVPSQLVSPLAIAVCADGALKQTIKSLLSSFVFIRIMFLYLLGIACNYVD